MYALTTGADVVRIVDGARIPDDPHNADRRAYEAWLALGNAPEPLPGPTQDVLLAYLADKRYRVETGGIVIPGDPPMPCWTDRATQSMLDRMSRCLEKGDAVEPVKVKVPNGFVSLSEAQVNAIGALVTAHVQACFSLEADLAAEIALGNITTTGAIDAAAWPSNT